MSAVDGRRLLAGALAAVFLVAGCSGGASPSPSGAASPSAAASVAGSAPASAVPSQSPTGELPKPELTTLRIGLNGTEPTQVTAKLAELFGYWKENGINTDISVFEGDGKVMQALQAGQLDIGFAAGVAMITSLTTDAPVKAVATTGVILSDDLVAIPSVKTAQDLKGKCVAVSTFGGTSHGSVLLALKALGLTPQDVVITEIGGQSARIAALKGGSCAAAPVDQNREDEMKSLGFNILVRLKDANIQWARTAMGMRADWLKQYPNTALVAVATVLRAQNDYWTQPEAVAEKYAEIAQVDLDTAKKIVADFQTIGDRTLMWQDAAFENAKEVLATVNPDINKVNIADAYDRSFLQKLVDIGYYAKLGIPLQ
jgi:ABC-type nitrate/sulfonate/bicarbonate transport system substrate-binding protein